MKYTNHKDDEENAEEDYKRTVGSGSRNLQQESPKQPLSMDFAEILWWILPRLAMAAIVLYAVIKIFNLLFPL